MARFIPDGVLKVTLAPAVADMEAPSLSEVNAGSDATPFLRSMSTPLEGSIVDISDVSSRFNKTTSGTYGGQEASMEFYRDDSQAADTMWNLLPRGTTIYAIIARRGGSGTDDAITTGDYVDVWKLEVVTRNPADYARNEPTGFMVTYAVPEEPTEDVQVGGGGGS